MALELEVLLYTISALNYRNHITEELLALAMNNETAPFRQQLCRCKGTLRLFETWKKSSFSRSQVEGLLLTARKTGEAFNRVC